MGIHGDRRANPAFWFPRDGAARRSSEDEGFGTVPPTIVDTAPFPGTVEYEIPTAGEYSALGTGALLPGG